MWNSRRREEKKLDARVLSTLRQNIERKRDAVYADPSSVENPDLAFERYMERTKWERQQITALEQLPLVTDLDLYGIVVPPEYIEDHTPSRLILNYQGTLWARRQISDYRMQRAKDWVAILMPILSLIFSSAIAILGLLVALKKR